MYSLQQVILAMMATSKLLPVLAQVALLSLQFGILTLAHYLYSSWPTLKTLPVAFGLALAMATSMAMAIDFLIWHGSGGADS